MNNFGTLHKDLLSKLSLELNLSDISELSKVNKRFNNLIIDDIFWMNKFYHDYGHYPKTLKSWNDFYKFVTITEPNDLVWIGVNKNILSYVVVALKLGAYIEDRRKIQYFYHSPLTKTSENGHLEVVKYLVEQGADICVDSDQALRWASRNGYLKVVKYLVEQGANIHARSEEALVFANMNGYLDVVDYLESVINNSTKTKTNN